MRIPSGKTDQLVYFVAVDSTDLKTRETGLSTFTVYRSRNGGAATAYTTPTVAELSAANMPGVYALTVDEDTTIAAGSDSEEYCVHITQASMAPVTRTVELYRRDTTTGTTITTSNLDAAISSRMATYTQPTGFLAATFPGTVASTTNITAGTITTVGTLTTYTGNSPQTGDAFARLGAPAGASVSADILVIDNLVDDLETRVGTPSNLGSGATVSANLVDIEGQTDDIGVAGAGLTNIGTIATVTTLTNLPAITANWLTAAGTAADFTTEIQTGLATAAALATVDGIVDDILLDTAEIGVAGAGLTNINLPNQTMDIVGNITGNLSGAVGSVTAGVAVATGGISNLSFAAGAIDSAAIASDAITSTELAQSAAQEIADEVLNRNLAGGGSGNTRNVRNTLRAIRNLVSESGGTLTIYEEDDVTPAWTATVTRTAATNPITSVDPA